MNIQLNHIAPYLPYSLGIYQENAYPLVNFILNANGGTGYIGINEVLNPLYKYLPILHPVSELLDEDFILEDIIQECENYCTGYDEWYESYIEHHNELSTFLQAPYEIIQKLLEKHYDVFDLISKGLAIDINTLNYKKL